MRKKSLLFLSAFIFLSLTGGCSVLSPQDCVNGDWYAIGYSDGAEGASRLRFNRHANFCQRYGTTPNLVAYDMGRERGLADFCAGGDDTRAISNSARYSKVCTRAEDDPLANPTVVQSNLRNLGIERTNLLRNIRPF